jgi:hypothetical protein
LKLSDYHAWSGQVKSWFGTEDGLPWGDDFMEFDEWWGWRHWLFEEPDYRHNGHIEVLANAEGAANWFREGHDENESFVVGVDLHGTKKSLMDAFEKILDERYKTDEGRPAYDSWAEYPMTTYPKLPALTMAISVKECLERRKKEGKPDDYWRIGVECRVDPDETMYIGEPTYLQKESLKKTVWKHLARSNDLIKGVEQGVFPAPPGFGNENASTMEASSG